MLSCRELAESASAYLDGELPAWRRLMVRLHVWMCAHCRRYVEQVRAVKEMLAAYGRTSTAPVSNELRAEFRQAFPPRDG